MKAYQPCTRRARKHAKAEASPWLNLQLSPVELGSQPLTWEQPDLMWSLAVSFMWYWQRWHIAATGTQLEELSWPLYQTALVYI